MISPIIIQFCLQHKTKGTTPKNEKKGLSVHTEDKPRLVLGVPVLTSYKLEPQLIRLVHGILSEQIYQKVYQGNNHSSDIFV